MDKRARLLIVDDFEMNRDALSRRLTRAGYMVDVAAHGRIALEMIDQNPYDMVLLDIMMPDIDGIEVLKTVRKRFSPAELPIIMVTARDRSNAMVEAFGLGASDYVTKPIDFPVVLARIEAQLRIREAMRQNDNATGSTRDSGWTEADDGPRSSRERSLNQDTDEAVLPGQRSDSTTAELRESRPPDEGGLEVGTRLGNYVITGEIGRCGMGVVYKAEDPELGRQAAIKILAHSRAGDERAVARFVLEARAVARFEHPNVVGLYDIGQWQDIHFIAMPFVARGSVMAMVREHGPLAWQEATRVIRDVCRGLVAAHGAGLIHRDIKPSNILIDEDGAAKLADFGLAKVVTPGERASEPLSTSGIMLGTPQYMSPEQCRADLLDVRSDIYALGASYFTLLVGHAPYQGDTVQILYGHCFDPVPDPRLVNNDIPEECTLIIQRAMAKSPVERYPNASDMLAALESRARDAEAGR